MADILLRGIDDDLHRRIKERAAAGGRSVNDLLVSEVIRWADRPTLPEWVATVERDARARPDGPTAAEIVEIVRRGRDAG